MNSLTLTGPLIMAFVVPSVIEPSIRHQRYVRLSIVLCLLYLFWFSTSILFDRNTVLIATNQASSAVINMTGLSYAIMIIKDKFLNR